MNASRGFPTDSDARFSSWNNKNINSLEPLNNRQLLKQAVKNKISRLFLRCVTCLSATLTPEEENVAYDFSILSSKSFY